MNKIVISAKEISAKDVEGFELTLKEHEPEMWQKADMITDQKSSTFLQFICIENIISVLEDIFWLIDVLIGGRKPLHNISHIPGEDSSWHLGILVFPGLFDFVPKQNEHKAKPWSTFHDFSWPKLIFFLYGNLAGRGKVGKYPFTPCFCPRTHRNNELLDLESKKLCWQGRNFWPDFCGNSETQFVSGNQSFWGERLDQHLK